MSKVTAALALGVIVLCVALIGPSLIDSTNDDVSESVEIYENRSEDLTDKLRVTSETIKPTKDTADITVTNLNTLNSSTQQLNDSQTKDYIIDGQTVTVTLEASQDGDDAEFSRLTVIYPPDFGWQSGAQSVLANMGVLIALSGFIMVAGLLTVVLKS